MVNQTLFPLSFIPRIDKTVTRLDYAQLSDEEKENLFAGIAYDPGKHIIVRIGIIVRPSAKRRPRGNYSNVDRVYAEVEIARNDINIVGMHPVKLRTKGDFAMQAFKLGLLEFKIEGEFKNFLRKTRDHYYGNHNRDIAQWYFLKPHIRNGGGYSLTLALEDPNGAARDGAVLQCGAMFLDGTRCIERIGKTPVSLD